MSKNTSVNSDKDPYLRKECWVSPRYNNRGEMVAPPILDAFRNTTERNKERLQYMLKNWSQVVEYQWK